MSRAMSLSRHVARLRLPRVGFRPYGLMTPGSSVTSGDHRICQHTKFVETRKILASANIACEANCHQAGLAEIQIYEVWLLRGPGTAPHLSDPRHTRGSPVRRSIGQLASNLAALLGRSPCVLPA